MSCNVAELSAMIVAMRWILRSGVAGPVCIGYDSEYAKCMTTGEWRPASNFAIIRRAKEMRVAVEAAGVNIRWCKIDSHSGHALNDRADALADLGARGFFRDLG